MGIVQEAFVLDGNYPGGNCPRWELTWEQLSRWQLSEGGKGGVAIVQGANF